MYGRKPSFAVITKPDRRTLRGERDHALLLFFYNSGTRADEAASLTVANLQLGSSPAVRILGKGNKLRLCPLSPATVAVLTRFVTGREDHDHVFLGRTQEPMTWFSVHCVVTQYADRAGQGVPSMMTKRITLHTIRHTTAVHLLRAGVDITTIRAWLGHAAG
ncbi:MAG: integrase/recombinase XerD [Burkholderiaceae bacterium]